MDVFLRQVLSVVATGLPAAILAVLVAWGCASPFKKIARSTAGMALLLSVVAYTAAGLFAFDTPNDFQKDVTGFVFTISVVVSGVLFFFHPSLNNGELGRAEDKVTHLAKVENEPANSKRTIMEKITEKIRNTWPILIVGIAMVTIWMARYEAIPIASEKTPGMYVLDRWTGAVTLYIGSTFYDTETRVDTE